MDYKDIAVCNYLVRKRGTPTLYKVGALNENGFLYLKRPNDPAGAGFVIIDKSVFDREWIVNPKNYDDIIFHCQDTVMRKQTFKVVAAAVMYEGFIAVGVRHFDELIGKQLMAKFSSFEGTKAIQGFVNAYGDFLTRSEAYVAARYNNQCSHKVDGELFSEDLY